VPSLSPERSRNRGHQKTPRRFRARGIYLSCGDSAATGLPDQSIDLVITDPPFFDNVHYFRTWPTSSMPGSGLLPGSDARSSQTTRDSAEVQDSDADRFAMKLEGVVSRMPPVVLKPDGLLVFSYHHSR